jgi:hypothetical protein
MFIVTLFKRRKLKRFDRQVHGHLGFITLHKNKEIVRICEMKVITRARKMRFI